MPKQTKKTNRSLLIAKRLLSGFKLVFFLVAVLGLYIYTRAGTPTRVEAATSSNLNFQARLLNASGSLVADGTYNIQFNLYTVSSGGSAEWTETYLNNASQGVTVRNGYMSVQLGSLTAFPGTINWDQDHWLGMTVRGTGSCAFGSCTPTDSEMTPRIKLTAVPYAFRAGGITSYNGTQSGNLSFSSVTNSPDIILPNISGTNNVLLQSGTTLFTQGSAVFTGANGLLAEDNTNFFFDDTNNTLGIGTTRTGAIDGTGNARLIVKGSGTTSSTSGLNVTNSSNASLFFVRDDGSVGIGTSAPNTMLDVAGDVAYRLGSDYTTTGSQNNVNLGTSTSLRYNGSGTATFTGIDNGVDGKLLYIHNVSASSLTFANNSGSSDPENRIITGTGIDFILTAGSSTSLQYDASGQKWRIITGTGPTSADNLQTTYDADSGSDDAIIALDATGSLIFRNPASSGTATGSALLTLDQLATGSQDALRVNSYGTGYALRIDDASGDTTPFLIDQNGNVGIGTSTPTTKLQVLSNSTTDIGQFGEFYASQISGSQTVPVTANGGSFTGLKANGGYSSATGTLFAAGGILGTATNSNTGTISAAVGVLGSGVNASTGTITNAYGLVSRNVSSSTGTINIAYGVYVAQPAGDVFGLSAATGTITTKYALVTEVNAGNVGIGNIAPTQRLDVTGAIRLGANGSANDVLNTTSGSAPSGNLFWGNRTLCDSSNNCTSTNTLPLSSIRAATTTNTIDSLNFAQSWGWSTLTSQTAMSLTGGSAMTTGTLLSLGSSTYNHTASQTGNLTSIAFTEGTSLNGAATTTTNGLNIASTINVAGGGSSSGTKTVNAINIQAPTLSACSGGTNTCAWNGLSITAPATTASYTSTALTVTANSLTTDTAVNISTTGLTSGAALKITGPSGATAVSNGVLQVSAAGNYSGTGGLLNLTATTSTAGSLVSFTNNTASYTGTIAKFSGTGITTGQLLNLTSGTGITTGSALVLTGASYNHGNATETGNLIDVAFTDATNGTATSTTNGLNIQPTINVTTGASGTKTINGIKLTAPTLTACTGGSTCVYTGLNVDTSGTLANSTIYSALFNGGNVGIGTATPTAKLHILTPANSGALRTSDGTVTTDIVNGTFGGDTGGWIGTLTNHPLYFYTNDGAPRLTVDTAGNVGIGTTTPTSFKLQVAGHLGPDANDTYDLGSTALRWKDLYLGGETIHLGTSLTDEATLGYDTTTNVFNIGTDGTTNGNIAFFTDDLFLEKASGQIGIGTASPAATLDVVGDFALRLAADYTTTGSQNNVNLGSSSSVRYSGAGTATFTGITGGQDGKLLYIHNASGSNLTISNQSGSSTDINRIITGTGGDHTMGTDTSIALQYDGTVDRWRIISGTGTASASNLQANYDADSGTDDAIIQLDSTGSIILRNPTSSTNGSAQTLQVDNQATGLIVANFKNVNATSTASFNTTSSALTNYGGYFSNTSTRSAGSNELTNVGLYASASGSQNNYAAIFENGNVGIGTTTPSATLHINSAGGGTDLFRVTDTTATAQDVFRITDGGASILRNQTDSAAAFQIQNAAGTSLLIADTSNSIIRPGIGSSTTATTRTTTEISNADIVGLSSSIAIGTDGLPVISYYNDTDDDLNIIKCGNAACSSGNTTTEISTADSVGFYSSIAIGTDGLPVISYHNDTDDDLNIIKCGNAACSSGNTTTEISNADFVGFYSSIAIGTDGLPVIAHKNDTDNEINVTKCTNVSCSSSTTTEISNADIVGSHSSIAIGTDGLPVISYYNDTDDDLNIIKCGNAACSSGNTTTEISTADSVGFYSSIAIGTDGLPVVSYRNTTDDDLNITKCGNAACSSGNTTTEISTADSVGSYSSIAIGTDGLPVVSYYNDTDDDLNITKCGNTGCSSGNTTTEISTADIVGLYTSIAIGTDGLPVVSHWNFTDDDLNITKCADASCAGSTGSALTSGIDLGTVAASFRSVYFDTLNLGRENARVSLNEQGNFMANNLFSSSAGNVGIGTTTPSATLHINSAGGGTDLFRVTDTTATAQDVFRITDGGASILRNQTDSAAAFQIQSAAGTSLFIADTSNSIIRPGITSSTTTVSQTTTEVSNADIVGEYSSIAIGTDGLPVISYYEDDTGGGGCGANECNIVITKCNDAACTGNNETTTNIENADDVGQWTSIAIGTDGLPIISYYNNTDDDLNVTKCGNASCSSGNTTTEITDADSVGQWTSIAIGTDGLPVISYYEDDTGGGGCGANECNIVITKCNDAACTGNNETTTNIENADDVGQWTSIAIGTDGLPVIGYQNTTDNDVNVTKCGNASCSSGNTTTEITNADSVGIYSSLAIGTDGIPVIAYKNSTDGDLNVTKCGNASCSSGNTATEITNADNVGEGASIAIGTDGLPVISYRNATDLELNVTKCNDIACTGNNETTTEFTLTDIAGLLFSIAIGTDGLPVISYQNGTDGDLNVTKCANIACSGSSGSALTSGVDLGTIAASWRSVYFDTLNLGRENARVVLNEQGSFIANGLFAGNTGNVGIGDTSPDALLEVLGTTEQLRLSNVDGTQDSRFTVDSSGNLTINNVGTSGYIRIGDTATPGLATGDDALFVEGNLEVNGTARFDGTLRAVGSVAEAAQTLDRIDIGVEAGTPRIVFEDSGSTIWEIDNNAGTFRWFTPGVVHMSMSTTETLLFDNVGIKTGGAAPGQELEVNGDIRLDANGGATLFGLCHSGADSDTTFANRDIVACSGAQAGVNDYAEFYPTDGDVTYGDLVALSDEIVETYAFHPDGSANMDKKVKISKLTKATASNQDKIVGIVSNNYTDFHSIGRAVLTDDQHPMPIALNGRVPLKVSTEAGPIQVGDRLTSSSIPGVAMKATEPGMTIGYALDNYTDPDPSAIQEIMVFVSLSSFDPSLMLNETLQTGSFNTLEVLGQANIANLNVSGNTTLSSLTVMGDATIEGNLVIVGDLTIQGNLKIEGGITTAIGNVDSDYVITASDSIITADATLNAFEATLPSAVGIAGRQYTIKKTDTSTNLVKLITVDGQTIDGVEYYTLTTQYKFITIVSDGTNWLIIANN